MDQNTTLACSASAQTVVNTAEHKESIGINNLEKLSPNNFEKFGSCEYLPPPKHCSTPKSKYSNVKNGNLQRLLDERNLVFKTSATSTWMDELRSNYAPECTSTLQSKSLFASICSKVKMLTNLTTKVIKMLHSQTFIIAKEFDHIYRCLENNCGNGVHSLVENLIYHMVNVLMEHSNYGSNFDPYYNVLNLIDPVCTEEPISLPDLVWKLNSLALDFSKRIDILLLNQIKIIVGVLESEQSNEALLITLNGLTEAGLQPDHLGNLLARCGGINTLVKLFDNNVNNATHMTILRILSTVCCTPSAIKAFKECSGLEILCEILANNNTDERKLKEGVLLILQVTGPWLQFKIIPLEKYITNLVSSLTGVVRKTFNSEMSLMSAAALANLSHEEISLKPLVNFGTVTAVLTAVRSQGAEANVFLKEQAATIILNLSGKPEFHLYLCDNRVIPAILCFLKLELTSMTSSLVEAATYRVQYKAALALARLCSETEAVHQVQQLQGVSRLIKLCKDGIEKNQQDEIVAASLEALKKIMASNKTEQMMVGKHVTSYTKHFVSTH